MRLLAETNFLLVQRILEFWAAAARITFIYVVFSSNWTFLESN